MLEYAAFQIDLERPAGKDSKQTKRQAYELLQRQGVTVAELDDQPELPCRLAYIWRWYGEIARMCREVTFTEIKAWQELRGFRLTNFELSAIIELESVRRRA